MKLHNWEERLSQLILEKQKSIFQWGINDCCLFACDAVLAVTGKDPGEQFRGRYNNLVQGARLLKEIGGGGIKELVDSLAVQYSMMPIKPIYAQRSDIGLYIDPRLGETLGVNIGRSFAFLMLDGMTYFPASEITHCWKVG